MMVSWAALAVVVCGGAGAEQWGARLQDNIGRGEGTYNPKSAWMFVDSRRRVLPDIDGKVLPRPVSCSGVLT